MLDKLHEMLSGMPPVATVIISIACMLFFWLCNDALDKAFAPAKRNGLYFGGHSHRSLLLGFDPLKRCARHGLPFGYCTGSDLLYNR